MTRSVLVVEDDARIRRVVQLTLAGEGFEVVEAGSGEEALDALRHHQPDVVLLDLVLPGIDGFEVCRRIRRGSDVPIIMVTARADSHDVVAGLEAGADDYVSKPFVPKELSARVRAALRRANGASAPHTITVGPLEISPEDAVVLRDGTRLDLTRTEFRLLCELASSPGRVFSREELLERVWGYGYFGDNRLVDVHVHRLRGKVEDDPSRPAHIVTVRGMGYRIQP
ncbi:DNA-binding response OmpR family regulator [Kineococcus xinjiangensis]|uniref:DNA-binding response OmpR family regulator n=1 Tax=Kineococcus xinjiangensis TaxID=512762 RepID=A0A2S6IFC5_9ACTN|nr:response regulator transcription factor [Kineococcus xinjiangensis]PPK92922.1 DNA-binding response OmpR family regulator [Kineococcus xinjiangensis]